MSRSRRAADILAAEFAPWYEVEYPRLLASLLLVTGDLELSKEVVDEAFCRSLAHWSRISRFPSPAGWTYKVAINLFRRRMRRMSLERRLLLKLPPPQNMPAPAGEIWAMVGALPVRQREVIVMRYVADMKEAEIAEILGLTRGSVSRSLSDARARLAFLLSDDESIGKSR